MPGEVTVRLVEAMGDELDGFACLSLSFAGGEGVRFGVPEEAEDARVDDASLSTELEYVAAPEAEAAVLWAFGEHALEGGLEWVPRTCITFAGRNIESGDEFGPMAGHMTV